MPSSKNAPRCNQNSLKHRWGLAQRQSVQPEAAKPESIKATPQRKTSALFGVDPDRRCAGQEKHSTQKDERSVRRASIESTLGISLGDKNPSDQKTNTVARAFGVTKLN